MPRVLLLLASRSYRADAFLAAARRMGVEVTVASDHRASLGDLAPDDSLHVRFDRPDPALERIASFARRVPLDAVVAAEDDGVILAARVADALDLPHGSPEAILTTRDKALFRERTCGAPWGVDGFRVVGADEAVDAAIQHVRFPCVVKPLSLSASRGVIRADDPDRLREAVTRVRRILADAGGADGRVLVEDFLPGQEVALEGLLTDGRLTTLALLDKPDPLDGPYFEETILVTPSGLGRSTAGVVREAVAEAASAVGLDQGPVHAELRVQDGKPRLLELAARSIGGRCSRILRFVGGRTLEEVLLGWALGERPDTRLEPGASGVMMLPIPGSGVLAGVAGVGQARLVPGVDDVEITHPLGEPVVPLPEGHRYLGFLFARADSPEDVVRSIRRAHRHIRVDLDA